MSTRQRGINDLVADVKNNKANRSYDRKILETLKEQERVSDYVIDENFLRNCFSYQLNGVLKYLLEKASEELERYFQNQKSGIPFIFQTECEQVAILIMKKYMEETWKIQFRNMLEENILHHFIVQGFQHAVLYLMDNHEIFDLCLQQNSAGNTPLMTMVSQNAADIALMVWDYMYKYDPFRLIGTIKHKNKSDKNILHLCTEFHEYNLLKAIVSIMKDDKMISRTGQVFENEIIFAFNESFPDKGKVYDKLLNQEVMLELFDIIGCNNIDLTYKDIKSDTLLHRLSQRDFSDAIKTIFSLEKNEIFRSLVFQKNGNGNTPLMSAAVNNSNKSLCYMLHRVIILDMSEEENEDLLHHQNNYGATLLGLVLRQQGTLLVPQTILLDLEKVHHGDEREVTKCFRANLQSSLEVHKALKNIEETYAKSQFKKIGICLRVFVFICLIPAFFMMFDMGTDIKLVHDYYNCYIYNHTSYTYTHANDTRQEDLLLQSCEGRNKSPMIEFMQNDTFQRGFYSYPDHLSTEAKFFYSLIFIIIPWIAYMIEFYLSKKFTLCIEVFLHVLLATILIYFCRK